jgi:amino acid adenylation domain-containing protein
VLLYVVHHIVSDGWSVDVLNRELAAYYAAFSGGAQPNLAPLPVQYPDFALWQRERLAGPALDRLSSYWMGKLSGAPPLLTIPTDRPRSNVRSKHGDSVAIELPEELVRAISRLCQQESVTLFMTLLAALKVTLARHSGQTDIVVGAPSAGREHAALEGLIGFFINTLPLRTELGSNPSFREILRRVRSTALDAYAHQELPFEKLVEKLQPERNLSHSPVFQVFLNMFTLGQVPATWGNLSATRYPVHEPGAKFDISIFASDLGGSMRLRAVYNADIFDPVTIQRIMERLRVVLESVTNHPEIPFASIPILTPADRRRYTVEDNPVRPSHPWESFEINPSCDSIPARFANIVAHHPDAVAVKTQSEQWTYAELEQRSNAIARQLGSKERGLGERIALLLDHDALMIASILGVLKAGMVYVPLDSDHPPDRLKRIIGDAEAATILTNTRHLPLADQLAGSGGNVINLDTLDFHAASGPPSTAIPSTAVAYLLYTSGSTGMPKGVVQTHLNVLHHIRNYTNSLRISSQDRLTLLASYGFDAAVMDIFGALLNGATLCPFDVTGDRLADLPSWVAGERITIYHSTPTLFRHVASAAGGPREFPHLRLVVMGGEKVVPQDIDIHRRRFGTRCLFINGYGPTESTVTLQNFVDPTQPVQSGQVPIGYPVDGVEVSLVDEEGTAGQVFGEIAIRSAFVAPGYWRRPDLTSAAFREDAAYPGVRTYRTGDLGRLLPNGMIESLGRRDFQVKIRGFRIELGEIEAAMRSCTVGSDCVAMAISDSPGGDRIVAYIGIASAGLDVNGLRSKLEARLPDYMIPSQFVILDAMPLTPNGKVDRNALPNPELRETAGVGSIAPRNGVESKLAEIWKEVLGLRQVGVEDDFIALGGHSMLGVRVLARVEQVFAKKLPLASIFQARTIARFGELLKRSEKPPDSFSLVPIQAQGTRRPLFGVHFLRYQALASHLGTDQPIYGLRYGIAASTGDSEIAMPGTIEELAGHYIREMRVMQPEGPYLLMGYSFGGGEAYEMARQLWEQGQRVGLLTLLDARISIERRRLPLAEVVRNLLNTGISGIVRRAAVIAKQRYQRISGKTYRPHEHVGVHDAMLRERYRPGPFSGDALLIKASHTTDLYRTYVPSEEAWRKYIRGHLQVREINAGHLGILEEPHVREVAAIVAKALGRPASGR